MFFVLSGFVLAHAYGERLDAGMTGFQFLWTRLLRLYPMYAVGVCIAAAAIMIEAITGTGAGGSGMSLLGWVTAALMLPGPPLGGNLYPLNGPAWSLLFELIANAIMGFAWRAITTRALVIGSASFAAVLALAILRLGNADAGWNWDFAPVGLMRVGFSYSIGLLLYRVRDHLRVPGAPLAAMIVAAAALCLPIGAPWRAAYDIGCISLLFPAVVLMGARKEPAIGAACWAELGLVSYPLYAIHQPLQRLVADAAGTIGWRVEAFEPWAGFVLLPALALIAWTLAAKYDLPVRSWAARSTRALRPAAAQGDVSV